MTLKNRIGRLEAGRPDPRDLPIQVVARVPTDDGREEASAVVVAGTDLGTISREHGETEGAFLRRVCALKAGEDMFANDIEAAQASTDDELARRYVVEGTLGDAYWTELLDRVAREGRRIGAGDALVSCGWGGAS
ncbi:hypothetical protein [Tropicimonas sp. IMCC6043]|uniref:hypothetical protein n=1 Tax=Tropicimonas sp. IMCC6043 TaxID=2510645 RepID=UPI00101C8A08|nr:hypothetical protein [Tropicimonas sp. IMCC6043]RYH08822.1 hypothetical protein EU800_15185 [Tropicimonas sp. IMCC6043]